MWTGQDKLCRGFNQQHSKFWLRESATVFPVGNSCYLFLPKSYFSRSPWYHHSFQPLPSWQVWEYQSPLRCVQVCFQLPPSGPWGLGIIHPGYHSSAAHLRQRFYQDLSWLICIQSANKIWNILFISPEQFNFHTWNCHFVDSLLPAMNDGIPPLRSRVISHLPSYFADMSSGAVCLFFFPFSFFLAFFFNMTHIFPLASDKVIVRDSRFPVS